MLYQMCAKEVTPLFVGGQDDNLTDAVGLDENSLSALHDWTDHRKAYLLSKVRVCACVCARLSLALSLPHRKAYLLSKVRAGNWGVLDPSPFTPYSPPTTRPSPLHRTLTTCCMQIPRQWNTVRNLLARMLHKDPTMRPTLTQVCVCVSPWLSLSLALSLPGSLSPWLSLSPLPRDEHSPAPRLPHHSSLHSPLSPSSRRSLLGSLPLTRPPSRPATDPRPPLCDRQKGRAVGRRPPRQAHLRRVHLLPRRGRQGPRDPSLPPLNWSGTAISPRTCPPSAPCPSLSKPRAPPAVHCVM